MAAQLLGVVVGLVLQIAGARLLQLPSQPERRPLIGILSQPGDGDGMKFINQLPVDDPRRLNMSYIAASYVKFAEAGGARVVPLLFNEPEDVLRKKFSAVNALLFPGGATEFEGSFYRTAELLFKMALGANDKGDYFPVFGTCLGFELLVTLVTQNHSILENFHAVDTPGPLHFWSKDHSLLKWFPKELLEKLEHENLAMENHVKGITPERWLSTKSLTDFFEVISTTPDLENKEYISTVQGRKYPITGVQWHPEKNAFEWGVPTIPHTADAIQVTQSAAAFFVSEARKSSHQATMDEEKRFLIYNYAPLYSGKDGNGHFDQSYIFW